MAYKHTLRSIFWIAAVIVLSIATGFIAAKGPLLAAAFCLAVALCCAYWAIRSIARTRDRVDYIVEATLNGDFSYKFPTDEVPADEEEINANLNRLVEHLERLSLEASRHEQFLSLIINLVDTGLIVADANGNVIHRNDAALKLLSLPVLTHICQIPADIPHLSIKQTQAALRGGNYDIYTVTDVRRPLQRAEVESW
ncbi:MAG: PAS domain-containing protein, partial [Muribaculaceae bacterium]|nr:PAS domain-containing protein [Muribaculaceae bacterium]